MKTTKFKGANPTIMEPKTIVKRQGLLGFIDKAKGFIAKLLKR